MNAVKHGMTARTPVLPGEDPDAFRHRLDSWAEALAPADAVEQFLVEQAATASWKIERADRVEAARLFAALRAAEDERRAGRRKEADSLGRLLLGLDGVAADPAIAQEALRILDPGNPGPIVDRRAPLRPIVDRLESTAEGCAWLLERWAELRAPLERGADWDEDRFVQAVRLSGRQPLNLAPEEWERYRQARHFGGVEEVEPSGDEEVDEERQEALEAAFSARVEAEDRRRMARQLVEDLPEDQAGARSALLGMVERASGRLTALASAHEARWEAGAVERAERMTFDPGPEDELLWRYQFGCGRSMQRMLETLLKVRRASKGEARAAGGGEGRNAAPSTVPDEAKGQEERGPVPPTVRVQPAAPTPLHDEAIAPAVAPAPPQDEATAPVAAPAPPQDEAIAPAVAPAPPQVEVIAPAVAPALPQVEVIAPVVARPSLRNEARPSAVEHPRLSPTEGLLIDRTATNEATAPPLVGLVSPDHIREDVGRGSPDPALSPTEGLLIPEKATNEATAPPLTGSGSPSASATEGLPPVFTDHCPLTTDHSPRTNEANGPAEDAVRSVQVPPAVVVGLLAVLFCAGFTTAFGAPVPSRVASPIAVQDQRSRRMSHDDKTMRNEANRNVRDLRAVSPGGLTRPLRAVEIAVHASRNRRTPGVSGRVIPAESRI